MTTIGRKPAFHVKNMRPEAKSPEAEDPHFARTVMEGLSNERKRLPSWLIFDDRGSELFEEILELEDYHPAVCEFEVFRTHKQAILDIVSDEALRVIDLGSGDARKTRVLLDHFVNNGPPFHYVPLDISAGAIRNLVGALESDYAGTPLRVTGVASEYFEGLEVVLNEEPARNAVFFLGSTIGNHDLPTAERFVRRLGETLNDGDYVMIGFDLMKDPKLLYRAYNDETGVFQKFNLHLLDCLNRKLGADFDVSRFVQQGHYNARTHAVESYIYSTEAQTVRFEALNTAFRFGLWEAMQTEHSYKYTLPEIEALAGDNGFEIVEHLFDSRRFFVDSIWKVKK